MLIAVGWILASAVAVLLAVEFVYFRRQRIICEKYPFYVLRDEVIWDLATNDEPKALLPLYETINRVVNELRQFDLRFHVRVFHSYLCDILAEAHRCGFDPSKDWSPKNPPLHPMEARFVRLMIETGRNNNLMVRLVTTPVGRFILLGVTLPVALRKVRRFVAIKHPALNATIETPRLYAQASVLARAA